MAHYYKVNPDILRRNYKKKISDFESWPQKQHAEEYLLYPENVSPFLAIDEVSLSKGELYTIVSSKDKRKSRKGKLVAVIANTQSEKIAEVLAKISSCEREKVLEISMDMAASMSKACSKAFPTASQVIDRFHVIRLVMDAMQSVRIKQRWKEIDKENELISKSKKSNTKYKPKVLSNGDTPKQLLARSRYLLYKHSSQWTESQQERAYHLFTSYPDICMAYKLCLEFRSIYELSTAADAKAKLYQWIKKVKEACIENFNSVVESIMNHIQGIMNFFNNKSTNAEAESFNAQIKLFRANQRGVKDVSFFLFRLEKLFA